MTEAPVLVTLEIKKAQFELAQSLYDILNDRQWVKASLLVTTNERGHMSNVIETTDEFGVVDVIDTPDSLHLPIISVRLAMRLPDESTFSTLVVALDNKGHTELNARYNREHQPVWQLPETLQTT